METIRTVCALGSLLTVLTDNPGRVVAGQDVGDLCQKNSDCNSGYCYQYPSSCTTEICGENYCVGNSPQITIQTQRNFFLLPPKMAGGSSGSDAAMKTNCTQQLSWETFTCVPLGFSQFALKTVDGQWVTATWGGGVGGQTLIRGRFNRTALKRSLGKHSRSSQVMQAQIQAPSSCALKSTNGSFVTAVNGGGYGNSDVANKFPIHTNATWAVPGPWEIFKFNFQ